MVFYKTLYIFLSSQSIFIIYGYFPLVIICIGNFEVNPGPMPHSCNSFSICHWDLNNFSAHNFIKVSLLGAYVTINKFDVISLSEAYLDLSDLSNEPNLDLTGYNLEQTIHLIPKKVVLASSLRTAFL